MEKSRIAMGPEAWKGSKIENPHCNSKEVDDRCCSCRCGNDGRAAGRRATDTLSCVLHFSSLLVSSCFKPRRATLFPLCLLLVFLCLYLYASRTHGIASRGSVYVSFRVEIPCCPLTQQPYLIPYHRMGHMNITFRIIRDRHREQGQNNTAYDR